MSILRDISEEADLSLDTDLRQNQSRAFDRLNSLQLLQAFGNLQLSKSPDEVVAGNSFP